MVTPEATSNSHPATCSHSILLNGLHGVMRTGRIVAARWSEKWRERNLVPTDCPDHQLRADRPSVSRIPGVPILTNSVRRHALSPLTTHQRRRRTPGEKDGRGHHV